MAKRKQKMKMRIMVAVLMLEVIKQNMVSIK